MLVNDYSFVKKYLTDIISKEQYFSDEKIPNSEIEIVSGNANRGADWLGEKFARENKLYLKLFPAAWNDMNVPMVSVGTHPLYGNYNKLAGTNRNQKMADYLKENQDAFVIAFDAEESKSSTGTKNMIRLSKKAGLKVYHIKCSNRNDVKIKIWNGQNV